MASTLGLRPTYYETLGLEPTATGEEIQRAFARELSRPRAFGGIAEISIAYETLRHPAKRRAYDLATGLARPTKVLSSKSAGAQVLPPPPERRLPSFLAASLRDGANGAAPPDDLPPATAEPAEQPGPEPEPELDAPGGEVFVRRDGRTRSRRRPTVAVGVLVAALGIIGAWVGQGTGDDFGKTATGAVKVTLPPANPVASPAGAITAIAASPEKARANSPLPLPDPTDSRTAAAAPQVVGPEAPPAEVAEADAQADVPAESAETLAESAPATEPGVNMPLPNSVIARTIKRIGYACGQVVSTSPVANAASGTFKVTCTSGQSYRAQTIRGRYHFRRWDRS